ncbi:PIG-L family deacetylase [Dactylosporangium sp. NPDC049742]|uniref:PIG-L family deacetylase n=1 Tax=Dactylosporangium sp. NPDC049742 TaxID=3154737 RepID=UPI00343317AE
MTSRAAATAVAAASCAAVLHAPPVHADPPSERIMQIIAHEDDDLYFMNPDVDEAIAQHSPTVTVYMTAGEGSGGVPGNSAQERARRRQQGAQNAYATMAGVADNNDTTQAEWSGAAWSVGGKTVERYTLTARPEIELIFMDLSDGNLANLYAGTPHNTIVPARQTLVTASQSYTKADAAAVLNAIMDVYKPTVLRAQDAEPDRRTADGYTADHTDHVAAASFARDAATAYNGPLYEVNYRDYNIAAVPINLDSAAQTRKRAVLTKYAANGYDAEVLSGLGTSGNANDNWSRRTYYRWSRGTQWAGRNADGRAQAFVVRSGQVVTYAQTAAGGWTGPTALPLSTGRLAPGIAVGTNLDGRLELFAHRLSDHHIVALRQSTVNGGFTGAWEDLGSPNSGWATFDNVGTPAVARRQDGRLQVFVKNGGGGLSHTYRTATDTWSGTWFDQGGSDLQDGLTAVTNPGGVIEVFGSTRTKVLHWYQSAPNGAFVADTTFPAGVPASPPSAAMNQAGAIDLVYRQPGTAHLMVTWQLAAGSGWDTSPDDIGGQGGIGEPCMITAPPGTDARIMLFSRNATTGVSTNRQYAANYGYGSWTNLSGGVLDYPAAAVGVGDRVVLLTIGTDGVYVSQQATAGGDEPFGAWTALGM